MFDPKKFTTGKVKPLPVYLLLDVSGSMAGEKLENLNSAVKLMIDDFINLGNSEIQIRLAILLFGSLSSIHTLPTYVDKIKWQELEIDKCKNNGHGEKGVTPMGVSFKDLKNLIEDRETTPSYAYRPLLVLVSDGKPNKGWQVHLQSLVEGGRSSKCDRMAMAIGKDADFNVLEMFVNGIGNTVFVANQAARIKEFFKLVTMSVTSRTNSMKRESGDE